MGGNLLSNYHEVVSIILFGIGFAALLLSRNLVKKFIGLNIADTAVYLFLASKGYVLGRAAPIVSVGGHNAADYINPIPTGLILTGIVISVSVTAFAFALIVKLYNRYKTLDLDEIIALSLLEKP
ncbi:MAG: cation:proton antiporter subunit C [Clostridiales bacterium]|nr:cation:proton antiporter subunit C [Clostridiales bacterium]